MIEDLMMKEYGFSLETDSRQMFANIVNSKFVSWIVLDTSDEMRPVEIYNGKSLVDALSRMQDDDKS
jgi:hypothetical protein